MLLYDVCVFRALLQTAPETCVCVSEERSFALVRAGGARATVCFETGGVRCFVFCGGGARVLV